MSDYPFIFACLFFCIGPGAIFAAGAWFGRVTVSRGLPRVSWSKMDGDL